MCNEVETILKGSKINLLVLFDACSFGVCVRRLIGTLAEYGKYVFILSEYKSWEYMMLRSNMFKDYFIAYNESQPCFEESYYESLLNSISSRSEHTGISHDSSSNISRCYIEKCCAYSGKNKSGCEFGVAGEDKFVSLFIGTEFEDLLVLARRL